MLEAHQVTVSSCTASVCIWLNKSRAAVHCPAFSQALIAALKTMVSATTWSLRMSPRRLKATCGRSTMRSQGEKRGDLAVSSINTDLAGHLTCGTCEDSEYFKKCLKQIFASFSIFLPSLKIEMKAGAMHMLLTPKRSWRCDQGFITLPAAQTSVWRIGPTTPTKTLATIGQPQPLALLAPALLLKDAWTALTPMFVG